MKLLTANESKQVTGASRNGGWEGGWGHSGGGSSSSDCGDNGCSW
ncbi:MAG: hypothetical protein E7H57_05520 [Pantoea sp.]|nr:hypothetical protein [Pantoea sp.]